MLYLKKNSNIITGDDILGKEALDPEGAILGVVTQIHINKKDKKIIGITIDAGFMKPDLFIGVNYIREFGIDTVLLKKVPVDKLKGLEVLTSHGELIGKVQDLIMQRTRIQEIIISNKSKKFKAKKLIIKYSGIKEIGDAIILKKDCGIKEVERKPIKSNF